MVLIRTSDYSAVAPSDWQKSSGSDTFPAGDMGMERVDIIYVRLWGIGGLKEDVG